MGYILGLLTGLALVAIYGFGHDPGDPPEWGPEPVTVRETPRVWPFDFSKEVIEDGPVRCYVVNPRGSTPAISCVVLRPGHG